LAKPTIALSPFDISDMLFGADPSFGATELSPFATTCPGFDGTLALPTSFGNIYFGETFFSYIRVFNHSDVDCHSVSVRVEFQSATAPANAKNILHDSAATPVALLGPDGSYDFIVQQTLKELGSHTLVCTVSYLDRDREKRQFRKYFKFAVLNPLNINIGVRTVKDGIFVQAAIGNATQSRIFLRSITFDPTHFFQAVEYCDQSEENELARDNKNENENPSTIAPPLITSEMTSRTLAPGDSTSCIFFLTAKSELENQARVATQLGRIDIRWSSSMGEKGRLFTPQVQRKVVSLPDVSVDLLGAPAQIGVEQVVLGTLQIANISDRPMTLDMVFLPDKMSSIVINGVTSRALGPVAPGEVKETTIALLALYPGFHALGGLRIFERGTSNFWDFDRIVSFLVGEGKEA
jgi:trafficking protein particle complex subunit 13